MTYVPQRRALAGLRPLALYRPGLLQYAHTRASAATFATSGGLLGVAPSGGLRDAHFVAGERTTLLEGTRGTPNLFSHSEQFDNAAWTKSGATVSANAATAPDGTATADKVVETATTGNHDVRRSIATTAGTVYAFSVYARAGERTRLRIHTWTPFTYGALFDLATGTAGPASGVLTPAGYGIEAVGGGWYRCWVNHTADGTAVTFAAVLTDAAAGSGYTGDGSSGLFLWGAQAEAGVLPTSYFPAGAAASARAGDLLTLPFPHAPQSMTAYARFREAGTTAYSAARVFEVGGGNVRLWLRTSGGRYELGHFTPTYVSSVAAAGPPVGAWVELRATLSDTGAVQLHQSVNGGTEASAAASADNPLAGAWGASTVTLGAESNGNNAGVNPITHALFLPGVHSLATCRRRAGA